MTNIDSGCSKKKDLPEIPTFQKLVKCAKHNKEEYNDLLDEFIGEKGIKILLINMDDWDLVESNVSDHASLIKRTLKCNHKPQQKSGNSQGEWNEFVKCKTDKLVEPLSEKKAQTMKKTRTGKYFRSQYPIYLLCEYDVTLATHPSE